MSGGVDPYHLCMVSNNDTYPKGPRAQIIGYQGPSTTILMVFGPYNPIIWVLGPLGVQAITCTLNVRLEVGLESMPKLGLGFSTAAVGTKRVDRVKMPV